MSSPRMPKSYRILSNLLRSVVAAPKALRRHLPCCCSFFVGSFTDGLPDDYSPAPAPNLMTKTNHFWTRVEMRITQTRCTILWESLLPCAPNHRYTGFRGFGKKTATSHRPPAMSPS